MEGRFIVGGDPPHPPGRRKTPPPLRWRSAPGRTVDKRPGSGWWARHKGAPGEFIAGGVWRSGPGPVAGCGQAPVRGQSSPRLPRRRFGRTVLRVSLRARRSSQRRS
ncbi:hypothetical protein GCM10010191_37120 [Actinomadura vinacea]|uniref:Uncharacterized protein n=1 Tax=Actinomadura vinacea TaxID=115336 RepID=A0ABP5W9F0_9ACTN